MTNNQFHIATVQDTLPPGRGFSVAAAAMTSLRRCTAFEGVATFVASSAKALFGDAAHPTLRIYRTFLVLGVTFLLAANCQAQTKREAPGVRQADSKRPAIPAPPVEAAVEPALDQNESTVDQINQIRQQMGGGVADQLKGLFDDPDAGRQSLQHDFDAQLMELRGQLQHATQRATGDAAGESGSQRRSLEPPGAWAYAQDRTSSQLPPAVSGRRPLFYPVEAYPVEAASFSSQKQAVRVRGIRQAARQLDETAADLEDYELFEAADRLREQAAQLRQQLR